MKRIIKIWLLLLIIITSQYFYFAMAQQNVPVRIKMEPAKEISLEKLKKSPLPVATVIEDVKDDNGNVVIAKGSEVYAIYKVEQSKDVEYKYELHTLVFQYIKSPSGKTIPVKGYLIFRTQKVDNKYFTFMLIPPITVLGIVLHTVRFFRNITFKESLKNAIFNFPEPIIITTETE